MQPYVDDPMHPLAEDVEIRLVVSSAGWILMNTGLGKLSWCASTCPFAHNEEPSGSAETGCFRLQNMKSYGLRSSIMWYITT